MFDHVTFAFSPGACARSTNVTENERHVCWKKVKPKRFVAHTSSA